MSAPLLFPDAHAPVTRPGLHALIIGVSAYTNLPRGDAPPTKYSFGMRQLTSTSLTAYRIYRWLVEHKDDLMPPLATIRLLLSPSPEEIAVKPELAGLTKPTTLDNFLKTAREWREAAKTDADNATFFYFAGHGVQRTGFDAVMLLEGYGDGTGGILHHAVDLNSLYFGMAPSNTQKTIARTQSYFIDACRILPAGLRKFQNLSPSPVFDVEEGGADDTRAPIVPDNRRAPIFFGAIPGTKSQAVPGDQTIFSKALLECLDRVAAKAYDDNDDGNVKWYISLSKLIEVLDERIEALNKRYGSKQEFMPCGSKDIRLLVLDGPPMVDVVLRVDPPQAHRSARVVAHQAVDNSPVAKIPFPLHPPLLYESRWPAGFYWLEVNIDPETQPFDRIKPELRKVEPPVFRWKRCLRTRSLAR